MNTKRIVTIMTILAALTSVFLISGFNVSAAENPYNYSGEPTRAIYYTLPTMKGADVKWVQAALNAYGNYGLTIDGSFGPACRDATKKFQASIGLAQDGSFGPATRARMVSWLSQNGYGATGGSSTGRPAVGSVNPYNYSGEPTRAIYYTLPTMKGADVKWVQAALNAYGGYGLTIDGSFGPACREATKKFQASIGLAQDGSFGPATRARMVSWLSQNGYAQASASGGGSSVSSGSKTFFYQGVNTGGCYTASAAMIMSNLGATWNGEPATYQNVYRANGDTYYFMVNTPGKFGCSLRRLQTSKSSVIDAVKQYPQGVMVAFYQPGRGRDHCMVAVGLNSSGEPLFFDPAMENGTNGGYGYTLSQTTTATSGGAGWNNLKQVSIIVR